MSVEQFEATAQSTDSTSAEGQIPKIQLIQHANTILISHKSSQFPFYFRKIQDKSEK